MIPLRAVPAALALLCLASGSAEAHSWYSEKTDPVYGNPCCGGTDCGMLVVGPQVLSAVPGGYHIRLTVEETASVGSYGFEAGEPITLRISTTGWAPTSAEVRAPLTPT